MIGPIGAGFKVAAGLRSGAKLAGRAAGAAKAGVVASPRAAAKGMAGLGSLGARGTVGAAKMTGRGIADAAAVAPISTTLGMGATGAFLADTGMDAWGDARQSELANVDSIEEQLYVEAMQERRIKAMSLDQEIFAQRRRKALAQLAQTSPQVFNEVSAGRRLPRGARVFGGSPRTDLLEMLASRMASGEYEARDPQQDLAALLGGL